MKNKIDVKEFREKGYLQELNRRFLHPLGLALEIIIYVIIEMMKKEYIIIYLTHQKKENNVL